MLAAPNYVLLFNIQIGFFSFLQISENVKTLYLVAPILTIKAFVSQSDLSIKNVLSNLAV
jgi:hypothetical protein